MLKITREITVDLAAPMQPVELPDLLTAGDGGGLALRVRLLEEGETPDLTGLSARGVCIRPDGQTVPLTGEMSADGAEVTVSRECLALPGCAVLLVRLTGADITLTVLRLQMTVQEGSYDTDHES